MRNDASTYIAHKTGVSRSLSGPALTLILVIGLLFATAMSFYNAALSLVGMLALTLVLVGLREPRWAAAALLASLAIIPVELSQNTLFGYNIENPLQVLVPLTLAVALLGALKDRGLPKPIVPDLLIIGLGIWGLLSLANAGQTPFDSYWNKYGNKLLFPLGFYVVVRLLPLDHRGLTQMIKIASVLVVVQAILIIFEARTGTSLYGEMHRGLPTGAFAYFWTAAAFLSMWPPLLIYVTSRAKSRFGWILGFLGLLITAYAITRTGQRGATFLLLILVPLCLLAPSMRKTAAAAIAIGMMLYVPWSMSGSGSHLLSRFDETDESRAAYRTVALELVQSDKWSPLFGIGPYTSPRTMRGIEISEDRSEQYLMHGKKVRGAADVAESGHALHNVYMSLLVEFGAVGALLAALAAVWLLYSALKIYRNPAADRALLVGTVGVLAAWGGIGYIHNIYSFAAPMCMFFFSYAAIVGKGEAFFPDGMQEATVDPKAVSRARAMRRSRLPKLKYPPRIPRLT